MGSFLTGIRVLALLARPFDADKRQFCFLQVTKVLCQSALLVAFALPVLAASPGQSKTGETKAAQTKTGETKAQTNLEQAQPVAATGEDVDRTTVAAPLEPPHLGEAPEMEDEGVTGTLSILLRMVMALAAIILLAYLLLHKGLGALSGKLNKGRLLRVVDRVGLEHKKTLYIVEVADRYYLIGTTDHGVNCLAALAEGEAKEAFDDLLRSDSPKAKGSAEATQATVPGGDNA